MNDDGESLTARLRTLHQRLAGDDAPRHMSIAQRKQAILDLLGGITDASRSTTKEGTERGAESGAGSRAGQAAGEHQRGPRQPRTASGILTNQPTRRPGKPARSGDRQRGVRPGGRSGARRPVAERLWSILFGE